MTKTPGCKHCGSKGSWSDLSFEYVTDDSSDRRRRKEKEQYNRLQLLDHAMKLATASANKATRTGRLTVGRVTADDVISHAKRLWKFVDAGE